MWCIFISLKCGIIGFHKAAGNTIGITWATKAILHCELVAQMLLAIKIMVTGVFVLKIILGDLLPVVNNGGHYVETLE